MHIITRKRLNAFAAKHPNAKPGLVHWYRTLKPAGQSHIHSNIFLTRSTVACGMLEEMMSRLA